jgi:hypothetical protein
MVQSKTYLEGGAAMFWKNFATLLFLRQKRLGSLKACCGTEDLYLRCVRGDGESHHE